MCLESIGNEYTNTGKLELCTYCVVEDPIGSEVGVARMMQWV